MGIRDTMKIAFFCNEYPPKFHGGIGTFTKAIAEALVKDGHFVMVVEFGAIKNLSIRNGVHVVTLEQSTIRKFSWLIDRIRLWNWVNMSCKSRDIDLMEIPDYQGWMPFPKFYSTTKIILRLHQTATAISIAEKKKPSARDKLCEKLTLFFNRNWIGVSQHIIECTKKLFSIHPENYKVVYNFVRL